MTPTGGTARHHVYPATLQRRIQAAVSKGGVDSHANVQTTMIYTHVATRNKTGVVSPLDRLRR
jgi:hypothetical protein